ncbi:Histidinol phosphatase of the PHP family protein [Hartmannibacter diazotrophicus]|uniref:Histidinol phosphatase of the PHP family protein n=1 Tax=Hartmannibacter diazotrophicus TaxID=1482074 RepID=A0A2C9D884_9HYPH|nr:Histidinol phosphatase of the PHP family protein [Hartmannibacter diazotrophicus]
MPGAVTPESTSDATDGHPKGGPIAENAAIASRLRNFSDLLDQQGAYGFRSRAYRRAAAALAGDWFERHFGKPEEHRAQSDPGGGGKHAVHR